MSAEAQQYKETLNLPRTRFEMKANLTTREPLLQKRWREMGLYDLVRQERHGAERRVLHDGPPYANGEIHMGHLLNKVLKDVIVRFLTMSGWDSPYVPGWDCHGLPIEHKVVKELGPKISGMSHADIRALCKKDALKWVDVQRKQFQRLGVLGDWEHPYLTLDPTYEAGILDVLATLVEGGFVFRQLKPIHWCMTDRTALAEAELEYKEESSPSVYVNFPMIQGLPGAWGHGPWHAMIWTTTPWTLPANVAIAVHPDLEYAAVKYHDPRLGQDVNAILAVALVSKVLALRGITEFRELGRCRGRDLEHARYRHVLVDRTGPLVLANYVSVEDGTGLVHTAPGHGAEDYRTGQLYGLPTLSPVDESGRFTPEAGEDLSGQRVFDANPKIIERLEALGAIFHGHSQQHSYPHCWRCKRPVIFRATEQWFIGADHNGLRERTLEAADRVHWVPGWGQGRIEAMLRNRPDWCISRQRSWGVPIPAFACDDCGTMLLTGASVRHVRDLFRQKGADCWFDDPPESLLPPGTLCQGCGGTSFRKQFDILDVWFESGSSHRAVLDEPKHGLGGSPAYLYLEGSDQHRGWFQSSILTSVGAKSQAPFQTVLTHGFIVDENGQKVSKSDLEERFGKGKVPVIYSAVPATETYGADVLRLYMASMDYTDDVRISELGIKEVSEAYRKIRNTFRYLLGNLEDYKHLQSLSLEPECLHAIDRWALGQLNQVIRDVSAAYERFELCRVYQRVYQFCAVDLSSFYLDVLKDRLYAENAVGSHRRAAQFVLARLHDTLTRLLAPIIPHTAEELWDFMPATEGKPASVHLARLPEADPRWDDPQRHAQWLFLMSLREQVLTALEGLRKNKQIGSAQEARVRIRCDATTAAQIDPELLATICIVSEVVVETAEDAAGPSFHAETSPHSKCQRCWNYRPTVGQDPSRPGLCRRCAEVLDGKSA